MNYVESNENIHKFVQKISSNTEADRKKVWTEHARYNIPMVKKYGWSCDTFFEKGKGKAVIIIGASPAVSTQLDKLRELQKDNDVVLVGISAGIRYLLENGIKPDYTFISDSSDKMMEWFEGIEDTTGLMLCADITANPKAVQMWLDKGGDVKYHAVYSAIEKLDKKIEKWYQPVNGAGYLLPSLSSQYNTAVAWAFQVLTSQVLIFVGNELSFPSDDCEKDKYYPDRTDEKDKQVRRPHPDIHGKKIWTTFILYQMKLVLEDYLGKVSGMGWFFNATEAGIFGVTPKGPVPWIYQFKLDMALKQAKNILYRGHPITSSIIQPTGQQIYQYTGATAPFLGGYNHVRL
jgi:hypothetical protein